MNDKKNLCIVTELFPPDETSTAYILGEVANAMTSKYSVKVICGPEVYDKRKKIDRENKFSLDPSIEVFRARATGFDKNTTVGKILSFLVVSLRLLSLVLRHTRKGDKVLMVTNPAPMLVLMGMLKQLKGYDLNVLVHDVFPENTKPAGIRLPLYSLVKGIFDRAYSRADQLIAIGRDMEDVLKRKTVPFGRSSHPLISVIENWADLENIHPQPMPQGKIILEYAGNIGRVQGLQRVIGQMPDDVEFHIYGTGAMEDSLKMMKHANVFFHGPYFRSQQNEVLAACHISLVTLQDGMYGLGVPSKTYNIMASGRPILFFGPEGSEIDRLVRDEGIGYCAWPESWDVEELKSMGMKARVVAERDYSKELILGKFLKQI